MWKRKSIRAKELGGSGCSELVESGRVAASRKGNPIFKESGTKSFEKRELGSVEVHVGSFEGNGAVENSENPSKVQQVGNCKALC